MGRMSPHITMMRTVGGMALLGVQLDDEMHCDIEVDICLGGQSNDLTLEGVLITIQPLGGSNESIVFLQLLEEFLYLSLFLLHEFAYFVHLKALYFLKTYQVLLEDYL